MIDSCVARLRKYKPEEYELIIAHFVIGISLRTIAKGEGALMALLEGVANRNRFYRGGCKYTCVK